METDCGARDGHCQHDTDRAFAFAETPGWRNPQSRREARWAPGSWHPWEMGAGAQRTRVGGKPCLLPAPLPTQVPWSEKWGESPQKMHLGGSRRLPPAERKEKTNTDGWGWRQRHPWAGRTDRRAHRRRVIREPDTARMTAREIQRQPERRVSRLTESTVVLRKEPYRTPAAGLIHQFFVSFQFCLFPSAQRWDLGNWMLKCNLKDR